MPSNTTSYEPPVRSAGRAAETEPGEVSLPMVASGFPDSSSKNTSAQAGTVPGVTSGPSAVAIRVLRLIGDLLPVSGVQRGNAGVAHRARRAGVGRRPEVPPAQREPAGELPGAAQRADRDDQQVDGDLH